MTTETGLFISSEDVGITHQGIGVIVRTEKDKITFEFGEYAKDWLTDPRMAKASEALILPLGDINRMWLVSKLNQYVETKLEEKNATDNT